MEFLKSASPPPRILRVETLTSTKTLPVCSLMSVQAACLWVTLVCVLLPCLKAVPALSPFFLLPHLSRRDLESRSCSQSLPLPPSVLGCVRFPSPQTAGMLCWGPGGHSDFNKQLLIQEELGGHIHMKTVIRAELLLQKLGTFRPGVQGRGRGPGACMCVC